jgi:signal transduction histidine kinase
LERAPKLLAGSTCAGLGRHYWRGIPPTCFNDNSQPYNRLPGYRCLSRWGDGHHRIIHVRSTNYHLERSHLAQLQLDGITRLAVVANRYSEQIAELLLVGEAERADLDDARNQVNEVLSELRRLITEEVAFLRARGDDSEGTEEQDRLTLVRGLLREIDRAVERLLLLSHEGRQDEAIALFRSEIENRLDADLESLIAAAIDDERGETIAAEEARRNSERQVTVGAAAALAILLVMTIGSGVAFSRSVLPPLNALADGAAALGRGDLSHRIPEFGTGELGFVASRFNAMAGELERQRSMLLDARNELESQVDARTTELTEANRRLTELDRERIRLLADVSHEIRTPLTVLRGEAEVTLRGMTKPERVYREALESIAAQATDMGRLIDDLLFIARSEAEEIRFDYRAVNLSDLVAAAAEEMQVLTEEKQIKVRVNLDANVSVTADPRRLKQALVIVLDNAVKYSPPDTQIDLAVKRQTEKAVEVRVRDGGFGIAPEDLPYVFDRFFRGESARESIASGSGLGLPIARWIVEKHRGGIAISSKLGTGTVARITLPIAST